MKYLLSLAILSCIMLTGCNSMYIKPGTLDPSEPIYTVAGGFSMKRSIKERMEERGYNVNIGKQIVNRTFGTNDGILDVNEYKMENVRYVVNVSERREKFFVPWCMFNGFWWWDFNVSIGDQQTGKEIFTWRGRGCANSSLRKLDDALDQLEMQDSDKPAPWTQKISSVKPG
ncbi:hypothetical protein LJC18_00860 [Lachnospiraceae bacterium OttesenSCG-928-E19]|nr:hypothetical protein [Lachnospiraceae bacterium OttesenSCG-928-E19]